jgi:hypothetical protein
VSTSAPLLATSYANVFWDATRSFVWFVRTELPYATIADIEWEGFAVERALLKVGQVRLLVDLRAVMPRDDKSFEIAIAKFRRKLLGGDRQVVILVRTAMGALQVKRHLREDGFRVEVLTQEDEAIAFLNGLPLDRAPPPSERRSRVWGSAAGSDCGGEESRRGRVRRPRTDTGALALDPAAAGTSLTRASEGSRLSTLTFGVFDIRHRSK